jgi:hypothetical protein
MRFDLHLTGYRSGMIDPHPVAGSVIVGLNVAGAGSCEVASCRLPRCRLRLAGYELRLAAVPRLKFGRATTQLENRVCKLH